MSNYCPAYDTTNAGYRDHDIVQPTLSVKRPCSSSSSDSGRQAQYRKSTLQNPSTNTRAVKPSFACPFLKMDPRKYSGPYWKCHDHTHNRIRDVKQHLSRSHMRPLCNRCGDLFRTEEELTRHNLDRIPCLPMKDAIVPDGIITKKQRAEVSKCPRGLSKNYEAQWFLVFRTIFPDHPRPASPYNTGLQDLLSFQDFSVREGPQIMARCLADIPQGDTRTAAERFRGALRDIITLWEAEDRSPSVCSTLGSTLGNTLSALPSPASTTTMPDPTSAWQDELAFEVKRDLVHGSIAVHETRRELGREIPDVICGSTVTRQAGSDDFNDGILSGAMWTMEVPPYVQDASWSYNV